MMASESPRKLTREYTESRLFDSYGPKSSFLYMAEMRQSFETKRKIVPRDNVFLKCLEIFATIFLIKSPFKGQQFCN